MIVSKKWLQSHIVEPLPTTDVLTQAFTFGAFEVEGVEEREGTTALDLKVLPDRANYALCHRGLARELAALLKVTLRPDTYADTRAKLAAGATLSAPAVRVEDARCTRYTATRYENVAGTSSPAWLAESLRALSERSINTLVDLTNYVMFDVGQPLHAFDADKVKGGLTVRAAHAGETMKTLDGKDLVLTPEQLVIADDEGPLALAGIKGGSRALVDVQTKNIILEAASFDASYIRKQSLAVGIRTESSKRFENKVSAARVDDAIALFHALITAEFPKATWSPVTEVYTKPETEHRTIHTTLAFINQRLGVVIPSAQVIDLCARSGFAAVLKEGQGADALTISVPGGRADIQNEHDIVEEIGRLYGYDKIPATMPAPLARAQEQNPTIIVAEAFRAMLHAQGFSEVYTPTIVASGSIRIANPLASDKCAMRVSLAENIERALELNVKNAPLFNASRINIFEMGTAFPALTAEEFHVCIGVRNAKKSKEKEDAVVVGVLNRIAEITAHPAFMALALKNQPKNGIVELTLSKELVADLAQTIEERVAKAGITFPALPTTRFVRYSAYPFIVRDIALFVQGGADAVPVQECIATAAREGVARIDARLERIDLFDIFTKKDEAGNERTSYGFRLVFISDSKTLSDDEANAVMEGVYTAVRARGWEVR